MEKSIGITKVMKKHKRSFQDTSKEKTEDNDNGKNNNKLEKQLKKLKLKIVINNINKEL